MPKLDSCFCFDIQKDPVAISALELEDSDSKELVEKKRHGLLVVLNLSRNQL